MEWRFLWCTAVALLVLLFVTTEGLRSHNTQIEDHKTPDVANRGASRFASKSTQETTTVSTSSSRPKSNRDRFSQSRRSSVSEKQDERTTVRTANEPESKSLNRSHHRATRTTDRSSVSTTEASSGSRRRSPGRQTEEPAKPEVTASRRNDRRYLPENNERRKPRGNDKDLALEVPKENLARNGPSVFTGTGDYSRSRTGRKIHTSYTSKEIKSEVPLSRKFANQNSETTTVAAQRITERINRSSRTKVGANINRKVQDTISEAESVRVDVPVAVGTTQNPVATTFVSETRVINRRSDTKEFSRTNTKDARGSDRTKGRGRSSSDVEASGSSPRSSSRRGHSRFSDFTTTEANEQTVSPRRNAGSRDRARTTEPKSRSSASDSEIKPRSSASDSRSRSRAGLGRNVETSSKASNSASGQEIRRRVSGDRNSERATRLSEGRGRAVENRAQDQDARGRSRSRSRSDSSTPTIPDSTTTAAPEITTVGDVVTSTEAEPMITTINPVTPAPTPTIRTTTRAPSTTSTTTESSSRNRGRGRTGNSQNRNPPKEDFFNHGLGFRGRKISPESSTVEPTRRPTAPRNDSQPRSNPGWTLRRRPGFSNNTESTTNTILPATKEQTNEVITSNEVLTSTEVITTIGSSTSTIRRGSKKQSTVDESKTISESTTKSTRRGNKTFEKNGSFGFGKSVESVESDNYPPEFKARLSQLKATDVKLPTPKTTTRTAPEVKKSAAALFAERSRMKLELARKLVKPELNIEDNDLEATSTVPSIDRSKLTEVPAADESMKAPETDGQSGRRGSAERSRKSSEESSTRSPLKKGRIISERMVTSISVEEQKTVEETTKPYESKPTSIGSAEEGAETSINSTRIRGPASKEASTKIKAQNATRTSRPVEKTAIKARKSHSYLTRGGKSSEQSVESTSTTAKPRKSYTSIRGNKSEEQRKPKTQERTTTKKPLLTNSVTKTGFRPRYSKRVKSKSQDNSRESENQTTTSRTLATSRYSRKKSDVKKLSDVKSKATTQGTVTRKHEFRPRTATYRRHSEFSTTSVQTSTRVPTTSVESLTRTPLISVETSTRIPSVSIESSTRTPMTSSEFSTKVDAAGVAITPRSPKYHSSVKSSTTTIRSVAQEPLVSLKIANDSAQQQSDGITGSSNGDSGNTNIFNPTRSLFLSGNSSLLEQLKSTVAPLLNSLGNKTPVFSAAYKNVNSANSGARITPNGSPPRFSARYKGAELFVRKPTAYQPTVPSITSSSSTASTPVENSGSVPPISVSSPGDQRFLTFYQAVESANITNEQRIPAAQLAGRVAQVDSNAPVAIGTNNSSSNNDTTSPTVATTASPQTPDTTVNTTQSDSTLTPRLPEEADSSTPMEALSSLETTPAPPSTSEASTSTVRTISRLSEDVQSEMATSSQDSLPPSTMATVDTSSEVNGSETTLSNESTTSIIDVSSTTQTPEQTMPGVTASNMDSENPDSNTIESATFVPAEPSSIDAFTPVSETTAAPIPTTTYRTRLIDFAQDILSRLQAVVTTTALPDRDFTTIQPPSEISNTIPGSDRNNSLQILSQLRETETTTMQSVQELTGSTQGIDQSDSGMSQETTALNTLGSFTTTSTQDTNTVDNSGRATQTPSAESTTVAVEARGQNADANVENSTDVQNFGNSLDPQLEAGTTEPAITASTTDTLLTELMSIAKTLLSEEVNETQPLSPDQSTTSGVIGITSTSSEGLAEVENLLENEVDVSSLNDALGTTQNSESSSDVTTETVESSSVPSVTTTVESSSPTVVTTSGNVEAISSVDQTQNEIESDVGLATTTLDTSAGESSTTPSSNVVESRVEAVQTTQSTPLTLAPTSENFEPSTTEMTSSQSPDKGADIVPKTTTQTQTTNTQSTEATVASTTNFELTTNTYDLMLPDIITTTQTPVGQTTEAESTGMLVTSSPGLTESTESVTEQSVNNTTNPPDVTTLPETILSRVNTLAFPVPSESTTEDEMGTAELAEIVTSDADMTNQTESATEVTNPLTTEPSSLPTTTVLTTAPATTTVANQSSLNIAATDGASNPATTTDTSTDTNATDENATPTTNIPQTTPRLENETPTIVDRFQDATPATAQGTAGSGIAQSDQPTETSIPTTTGSSLFSSSSRPSLPTVTGTTVSPSAGTIATTTTETATPTTTERLLDERTSTTVTEPSRAEVITVTAVPETTTADINENLVSTEAASGTTLPSDSISRMDVRVTMDMGGSTTPGGPAATSAQSTRPPIGPTAATVPYLGRFGGSRLTPAPRFSPSSSTKAPLRDYLIYGIYPNKTIVRKRPEDNLIDARNVDSPYVIFGIFPDGRLVRKFPNGTIIPDPPRSPVEVVFSLSTTTTTNRPPPRPYYNQANQGTYNQYQVPAYYNNRSPAAGELMRNVQTPGAVDLGLTGNAIVGPNGGGPDFPGPLGTPASVPTTGKMSDLLLNTRMGTAANASTAIAGLLTPIASTGAPVRPPTDSQGGRIVQDRERDEATRTKEAGGQRSSVYIGQDKLVNYWTEGSSSTASPRVVSVRINSVASAANEGSSPAAVPSFENLLNNQPADQVTAPPGFPWRDPLDQIFGVTTGSPVLTASVATNTLDDSAESNVKIGARPINPFVEVFTPVSSTIASAQITASTPETIATTRTGASTTTSAPTTTGAPYTTTAPPVSSTTPATVNIASQGTTASQILRLGVPSTTPFGVPQNLENVQTQNAFGTTFDDLAFLNSLLHSPSLGSTTTPKTLTQVEQLLANKILSLALNNPGPTRAGKAIELANASPNSLGQGSTYKPPQGPIIIDLFPSSTAKSPTWNPVTQQVTSQKPTQSSWPPDRVTFKPVSSSTATAKRESVSSTTTSTTTAKPTVISTTKGPVVIVQKKATTPRPRTTTQAPLGFGASLWQAIFGGNLFAPPSTTARPVKTVTKPVATTPKYVDITPKPVQITQKPVNVIQKLAQTTQMIQVTSQAPTTSAPTLQTVNVSKVQVVTPNSITKDDKLANAISTTKEPLLNNPNPRVPSVASSTYSPEEDAQFLAALLRAVQTDSKASAAKKASSLPQDDQQFLRAILSGRALTTTSTTPSSEISDAALLAVLLKAQGIEPQAPGNSIREQLQLASLGQSVTSAPTASSATGSTTITTRPAPTAARPTITTKKTVTPRPTSRPRPRTTTWSPSSTYPPPLFGSFANYGTPAGENSGNAGIFGATRAFSQFLGAAITGAAQQLQSLVRNGTRIVSEAVG